VVGVDVDAGKVDAINSGFSPVAETGLDELVREQVGLGKLRATTSPEDAVQSTDIAVITVGTPSAEDGAVRSDAVERVIKSIGQVLRSSSDKTFGIVVRSTLLPGVLEERLAPILAEALGEPVGERVWLCNNPEFLRESSAIRDYDSPPFILVGSQDETHARQVLNLYRHVKAEHYCTDTRTAALVKYASNAFHALKVTFANEIGTLARSFGANGHEVMDLVCRDRKLNISPAYLRPGFAFGGSCLPKDLRAIVRAAEQRALSLEVLSSILPSNEVHLRRAVRMIQESREKRVGVVGLSFKAGTDDLRESPMVILAETLLGRGYDLRIYDPGISVDRLRGRNLAYVDRHLPHLAALLINDPEQLFGHARLLVLGTDVADQLDWRLRNGQEVIDLRRDLASCPAPVDTLAVAESAAC
jgi:GDP-mannose 6-dehydrogenase